MAKRSTINTLEADDRNWIDRQLVDGGFADYTDLVEKCKERGIEISRSALHRYGQRFEDRLSRLRMSTEMATQVVTAVGDDDGATNTALIRLLQNRIWDFLFALDNAKDGDDEEGSEGGIDPKVISSLTRAVADLSRADVNLSKYRETLRKQLAEKSDEAMQAATKMGISKENAEAICKHFLGVEI